MLNIIFFYIRIFLPVSYTHLNGMKVKGHLYFMHDVMKNVTSIFDGQHTRRARYEYAPFGSLLTLSLIHIF